MHTGYRRWTQMKTSTIHWAICRRQESRLSGSGHLMVSSLTPEFGARSWWSLSDVTTIPENGTWFQLIANGTTTLNTGANGLQRLDTVIQLAEKHNIFVLLSLTNNWNPLPLLDNITDSLTPSITARDVTQGTNNSLPRNTLSNDYGNNATVYYIGVCYWIWHLLGGMDAYVREFGNGNKSHDQFYTSPAVQTQFMNYVTNIVNRYVNNTSVFSW